jgi:hypothetical protein
MQWIITYTFATELEDSRGAVGDWVTVVRLDEHSTQGRSFQNGNHHDGMVDRLRYQPWPMGHGMEYIYCMLEI